MFDAFDLTIAHLLHPPLEVKSVDRGPERGWLLPSARVVEKESRKGMTQSSSTNGIFAEVNASIEAPGDDVNAGYRQR